MTIHINKPSSGGTHVNDAGNDTVSGSGASIERPSGIAGNPGGGTVEGGSADHYGADVPSSGGTGQIVETQPVTPPENERTVSATAAPKAGMSADSASSMKKDEDTKGLKSAAKETSVSSASVEQESSTLVPKVSADEVASGGSAGVESGGRHQLSGNQLTNNGFRMKPPKKKKTEANLIDMLVAAPKEDAEKQRQAEITSAQAEDAASRAKQEQAVEAKAKAFAAEQENEKKGKSGPGSTAVSGERVDQGKPVYVKEGLFDGGARKGDPFNMDASRRALIYPRLDEEGNRVVDEDEMWSAWEEYNRKNYTASRRMAVDAAGVERFGGLNPDNSALFGTKEENEKRWLPPVDRVGEVVNEVYYDAEGDVKGFDPDIADYEDLNPNAAKRRAFARSRNRTAESIARPEMTRVEGDRLAPYYADNGGGGKKKTNAYHAIHSPKVQKLINTLRKEYSCSEHAVMSMYQYAASLGYDNSGKRVGQENFRWSYEDLVKLTKQIMDSQAKYNHPFGVANEYAYIGNTKCYPCGYVDRFTLQELSRSRKSPLHGRSVEELQMDIQKTWDEFTLRDLMLDTRYAEKGSKEYAQREQVMNFARAAMSLDDRQDYSSLGITMNSDSRCSLEIMHDNAKKMAEDMGFEPGPSDKIVMKAAEASREVAAAATENARQQNYKTNHAKKATQLIQSYTSSIRFSGILRPELALANFAEKVLGVGMTSLADRATSKVISKLAESRGVDKATVQEADRMFAVNDEIKQLADRKDSEAMMNCFYFVTGSAGMDALTAYCTSEEARSAWGNPKATVAWLRTWIGEQELEAKDDKGKLRKLDQAKASLADLTQKIMTGGGMTNRMDTYAFYRGCLMNMKGSYLKHEEGKGEAVVATVSTSDILEMARAESPAAAMAHMAALHEGRDAFLSLNQLTSNRRTPTSAIVEQFLKDHGITDAVFATFVDRFLSFSIKQLSLWLPMTTTINCLLQRGFIKNKASISIGEELYQNRSRENSGGISSLDESLDKWEAVAVGNTMGMDEAYGLAKCIIYDSMMIGNRAMVFGLFLSLHALFDGLGDDDDDDPDELLKANPIEQSFGGFFKLVPAWWAYDMIGEGYGAAQAAWHYIKTGDLGTSWNVFVNSLADALSGSALFDTVDMVMSVIENGNTWSQLVDDPDADLSGLTPLHTYSQEAFARFLKNITPAFLNAYTKESLFFGHEQRDHTAYKYYDSEGNAQNIDSTDEILMRTLAKNNVAYAALLNIFKKGDNQYNENTGYFWWEMPVATQADQVSMVYYNRYNLENYESMTNAEKDLAAQSLLADLEGFGSPAQALAQGLVIPYNAKKNLAEYLTGRKQAAYWEFQKAVEEDGWTDVAYGLLYNYQTVKKDVETKLNAWCYNSAIPSSLDRYEKLVTDYETAYVWTSGPNEGQVASAWDYYTNRSQVEKKYYRTGNASSTILPFTLVDKTSNYNDEVANDWYVEDGQFKTDKDQIRDTIGSSAISMGGEAGQLLWPTIAGSQDVFNKDMNAETRIGEGATTTNTRRLVASEDNKTLNDLSEDELRSAAERAGVNYDEYKASLESYNNSSGSSSKSTKSGSTGSSYGSRSYSRSSSGGSYSKSYSSKSSSSSSYTPRIYSSTHNLYTKSAQGMNVKSPYKASTTYLKPGFSTKGSREAYKRSDM